MDKVGVMAAYCGRVCSSLYRKTLCLCVFHCIGRHYALQCLPVATVNYTLAQRVGICCSGTELVHVNGHDRIILVILAEHCTWLSDDGSSVIRNMLEHF